MAEPENAAGTAGRADPRAQLLDSAPALLLLIAPDGRILYANQAVRDITGAPPSEVEQPDWMRRVHPDDVPPLAEGARRAIRERSQEEVEYRLRAEDGSYRWILQRGRPLFDDDGTFVGVALCGFDIDEHRRAEQRLQEANRLQEEFLGFLAHELRRPTTSVIGYARLLKRRAHEPAEQREDLLAELLAEAERLERLLSQMQLLSPLGRTEAETAIFDLSETAHEAVAALPELAGRTVRVDVPSGMRTVGSRDWTRLVIENLLTNAAKYGDPAGSIDLTACVSPDATVIVRCLDRGPGVRPEDVMRIFEPFYRVPGTSAPGAGLGLTLCRRLVRLQGGEIWAAPRDDGGTEVAFTLPAAPPAVAPAIGDTDRP